MLTDIACIIQPETAAHHARNIPNHMWSKCDCKTNEWTKRKKKSVPTTRMRQPNKSKTRLRSKRINKIVCWMPIVRIWNGKKGLNIAKKKSKAAAAAAAATTQGCIHLCKMCMRAFSLSLSLPYFKSSWLQCARLNPPILSLVQFYILLMLTPC